MTKSGRPYEFDEFFSSNMEETLSPFLKPSSKKIAQNLSLKSALTAFFLLIAAWISHAFSVDLGSIFLVGVYFLVGTPALIDSLYDLKDFDINIDVLMTLAALLSLLLGSPFEGALLLVLFALSGAIEKNVSLKTKSALHSLNDLSPSLAYVKTIDGHTELKSVKSIEKTALVVVKAGEVVPLDGTVIEGASYVNLVHLTGESTPILKNIGADVAAGSKNLDGVLTIEVTKTYRESTLYQIIELITQAQQSKPKVQKILDQYGQRYASTIIGLSFLFACTLPLFFSLSYFGQEGSIYRALSFLIAASPCALIIATPTAYLSAISSAAKKGVLLKGGVIFDALTSCKTIAFDKTGTLTQGELTLEKIDIPPNSRFDHRLLLQIASSIELVSKHPIAEAITRSALKENLPLLEVSELESVAGMGVKGKIAILDAWHFVKIGRFAFLDLDPTYQKQSIAIETNQIAAYLQIDKELFVFYFRDALKPDLSKLIKTLKNQLHLKVALLTGDHESSALAVAKAIGIDSVYSELKPHDKLQLIADLSSKEPVAMVGDGINDAPSLARAHVGISMGKIGSKAAIDASDVVFLKDDLQLLPWLLMKAKTTRMIVFQNLSLALGVIGFASFLALGGVIPLWLAVILHEGGTILVGLNSLRLLKK